MIQKVCGAAAMRPFARLLWTLVVLMCRYYRRDGQTIHEDSQSDVADVRRQIARNQANGNAHVRSRHTDRDYTCPVCMDEASFSVETNCGHVFCGEI